MPKSKPQNLRQASLFDAFSPSPASPPRKQKKKRKQRTPPPPIASPVYSSPTRNARYLNPTRVSTPEEDEVVDDIKFEASPTAGPSSKRQTTVVVDSDDDDLDVSPATFPHAHAASRKRKRPAQTSSSASDSPASGVIEISSGEDEEPPAKKSKTKAKDVKKSKVARGKQKARRVSDDDEEEVDDDDDLPVVKTPAKRRFVRGRRSSPVADEDGGSPPAEPRPGKRRLARGGRAHKSSLEDDNVYEDEDSLMMEVDEEAIVGSRLRTRDKKTAFQKNLEKLRRRKQGKPDIPSSSEEGEDGDVSSDDDADKSKPFKGARPADEPSDEEENANGEEEEDTFIVDDDDDQVATELPPEFSMSTHQDMMHHFKTVFQLFVHVAVQKPADREDFMQTQIEKEQYFSVPLQIVRRKIDSLRFVLVESSRFKPEFKKRVSRYPHFEMHKMDFAVAGCDACTMGSRISTIAGRLSGTPYKKIGFQPSPLNEDSSSDSESDEADDDTEADQTKEMHLGRICAKRVRILHQFSHWDYSLFQAVDDEVSRLRSSTITSSPSKKEKKNKKSPSTEPTNNTGTLSGFVKVAHANGLQPPTDMDDADGICEWLDERGIIGLEWQRVKSMLKDAQDLASNVYKRGDKEDDVYS